MLYHCCCAGRSDSPPLWWHCRTTYRRRLDRIICNYAASAYLSISLDESLAWRSLPSRTGVALGRRGLRRWFWHVDLPLDLRGHPGSSTLDHSWSPRWDRQICESLRTNTYRNCAFSQRTPVGGNCSTYMRARFYSRNYLGDHTSMGKYKVHFCTGRRLDKSATAYRSARDYQLHEVCCAPHYQRRNATWKHTSDRYTLTTTYPQSPVHLLHPCPCNQLVHMAPPRTFPRTTPCCPPNAFWNLLSSAFLR